MSFDYKLILKTGVVLLVLDILYISIIYNKFDKLITDVQGAPIKLNIYSAILCYSCIICMLYYFIIKQNKSVLDAVILGVCTYGIYEFTNMSILNKWDMNIALTDTLWGGLLYGLTTYIISNNII
jgi:uncharacterized membrane protein